MPIILGRRFDSCALERESDAVAQLVLNLETANKQGHLAITVCFRGGRARCNKRIADCCQGAVYRAIWRCLRASTFDSIKEHSESRSRGLNQCSRPNQSRSTSVRHRREVLCDPEDSMSLSQIGSRLQLFLHGQERRLLEPEFQQRLAGNRELLTPCRIGDDCSTSSTGERTNSGALSSSC